MSESQQLERLARFVLALVRDGYSYGDALNEIGRRYMIDPAGIIKVDRAYQNLFK